jgi:hypothetical protein
MTWYQTWYQLRHESGHFVHRDADPARDGGWRLTDDPAEALGSYDPEELPICNGTMPPFERTFAVRGKED